MLCRVCSREIPDNSIFCNWCGEKQIKPRRKKSAGITVPKATQKPSGSWFIQLRLGGQSYPVTATTEKECIQEATRIKSEWKAGKLERKTAAGPTLSEAIDAYIAKRGNTLSPSTIDGYRRIQRNRFRAVMGCPVNEVHDWQSICDTEAAICSPKTLRNAYRFVASVLRENSVTPQPVTMPTLQNNPRPWLEPEQIKLLVASAKGTPGELPALLALHSLRRSEILALQWDNVDLKSGRITVQGAVVQNEEHQFIRRESNKNATSARTVPIMIPELRAALEAVPPDNRVGCVVACSAHAVANRINSLCRSAGLPEVGTHGLRHSFASLAYHLQMTELECMEIGGWADAATMRKIYTHLAAADRLKAENKMSAFYGENATKNATEV